MCEFGGGAGRQVRTGLDISMVIEELADIEESAAVYIGVEVR